MCSGCSWYCPWKIGTSPYGPMVPWSLAVYLVGGLDKLWWVHTQKHHRATDQFLNSFHLL